MSAWLQQQQAWAHGALLVAVAVVSGSVVGGSILGYQHLQYRIAIQDLNSHLPTHDDDTKVETVLDIETALTTNILTGYSRYLTMPYPKSNQQVLIRKINVLRHLRGELRLVTTIKV